MTAVLITTTLLGWMLAAYQHRQRKHDVRAEAKVWKAICRASNRRVRRRAAERGFRRGLRVTCKRCATDGFNAGWDRAMDAYEEQMIASFVRKAERREMARCN